MPIFDVEYHSNLEVGQIVQSCDCANAFIEVIPEYERDYASIPFTGSLYPIHNLAHHIDASGANVATWMTNKHRIATYNLDVLPRIGATHHDYKSVLLGDNFKKDIAFMGDKTALVRVKISRKESLIYTHAPELT